MTLFVPTEDTIFGYTTLEQSVVLYLKKLEVKNPNTGTIDELLKRIMEGPPGQDIDRSLIGGDDALATRLSGGTSLLSMPSSMEVREFSVKDWLVDDAKEPDVEVVVEVQQKMTAKRKSKRGWRRNSRTRNPLIVGRS